MPGGGKTGISPQECIKIRFGEKTYVILFRG